MPRAWLRSEPSFRYCRFGVTATWCLGLLTQECSGSLSCGAFAALIMALVPAHIMRSVGGGYDNESIAMTAMCLTFYLWCRALRADAKPAAAAAKSEGGDASSEAGAGSVAPATRSSYVYGVLCGLAYIYMVAAWGGFVFVLNMIGLHAAMLVVIGRYTSSLHRAYTLFFIVGTFGATRVPPVGMNPFKSMEQLAPLLVFLGFQVLEVANVQRQKRGLTVAQTLQLLLKLSAPCLVALLLLTSYLMSIGYFGPLTARVRGLFVKHTRTGNPLVDSVAEHQPGSTQAYQTYLHHVYYLAPLGFFLSCARWTDANSFIVLWAYTAYYFASKMSRLVILLGPVAAALGGVALGRLFDLLITSAAAQALGLDEEEEEADASGGKDGKGAKGAKGKDGKKGGGDGKKKEAVSSFGAKKKGRKSGKGLAEELSLLVESLRETATGLRELVTESLYTPASATVRLTVGLAICIGSFSSVLQFYAYSHQFAERSSQPQIMFKAQLNNGQQVIVDDYREGYHWLRDRTPEDARVMAWWDYGYQIAGIAKRTSIADGNTWNHEHIATLGRIMTSSEEEAHSLARHLADYVLVWAGGGGDDLAKSPHLARIGNSVYPGHCADPTCSQFGFHQDRSPTPMMASSLLYKLCMAGQMGVKVNETYFQHVYTTKYGKMRIYKVKRVSLKSKNWIANASNRVCDAPGSWYCVGQYPPALRSFISKRRDFAQLEDFNVKRDAHSKKYHEEYMRRMGSK